MISQTEWREETSREKTQPVAVVYISVFCEHVHEHKEWFKGREKGGMEEKSKGFENCFKVRGKGNGKEISKRDSNLRKKVKNQFGSGKGQMSLVSKKLTFRCNVQMKKEGGVMSQGRELEYVSKES